jgi:hypothetical protein
MSIDWNALPPGKIQYLPEHRCPRCSAPGEPYEPLGVRLPDWPEWIHTWRYYGEDMSPVTKSWEPRVGTVLFGCHCRHHSGRSLRVVHLGDAILPLTFIDDWNSPLKDLAGSLDPGDLAVLNRLCIARSVKYLADHADPARLAGVDVLRRVLFAVASGAEQPDHAYQCIQKLLTGKRAELQSVSKPGEDRTSDWSPA